MAISASVQENWRTMLARIFARDLAGVWDTHRELTYFKIGEGGSVGGLPITPNPAYIDLESEGTPKTGLATFTNGVAAVTGDGSCNFLVDFAPGDWIKPGPRTTGVPTPSPYALGYPGTEYDWWGQVLNVVGANSLNLTAPYAGATTPETRMPMKAASPLFTFRKALPLGDVSFLSALPAITEITSIVGAAEANADQLGASPIFYELGLFDEDGVMAVYCTFDAQTKILGVQLNTIIQLVF